MGFMRLMQERAAGKVYSFEQWWRIREMYQSFVRLEKKLTSLVDLQDQ